MPDITLLYAGLLGLIWMALSFRAGSLRGKTGISIGDGGNPQLLLEMRRQANFVEAVPLLLLIIALLEMNGVGAYVIHAMGAALVIARVAHPMGLQADTMSGLGRVVGAMLTALLMLVASVWAIVRAVSMALGS